MRSLYRTISLLLLCVIWLASCKPATVPAVTDAVGEATEATLPTAQSPTPVPPTETATKAPPTLTASPTELPDTATPTSTLTATASPTETKAIPTVSGNQAIYIYLIQTDTGGPVACGDSLIPVNTGLPRTSNIEADITSALSRLLVKKKYIAGLYNPAWLSNILIQSVNFKTNAGIVQIRLTGTYVRSGDRCDDSRVRAQIWTTIRQFKQVKTIDITLNGNLLGDILATGK